MLVKHQGHQVNRQAMLHGTRTNTGMNSGYAHQTVEDGHESIKQHMNLLHWEIGQIQHLLDLHLEVK